MERYPFPHNTKYTYGIMPNRSQDEMNQTMLRLYNKWRELYVTKEGCQEGEVRIYGGNCYNEGSCSEGISYGMVISVYMAAPDNHAHEDFDGLYRFFIRHRIPECGLMKWLTDKNGVALSEVSAPDGDMDIAYALLMADRQWGSEGVINYREEALTQIGNIMKYAVNKPQYTISRAQIMDPKEHFLDFTMPAYQMAAYARRFAEETKDPEWDKVVDGIYNMCKYFYELNPDTGLPPYVFAVQNLGPVPQKGSNNQSFSYDSCRVPWRIAMDYLWNGGLSDMAHDFPNRNVAWFQRYMESIHWNFDEVNASYDLKGVPRSDAKSPRNIVAMMATAAMVDEYNQEFLNKSYEYLSNLELTYEWPGDYFQDILVVLGMLLITGNMPKIP